jgi:hypothetical protein
METLLKGKAESIVNHVPRGNNVIIKIETTGSVMEISSGKISEATKENKATFTVVAFGPLVPADLNIGDEVAVLINQAYSQIQVIGNGNSIKELQRTYKSMKPSEVSLLIQNAKTATVDVIDYGIFPEYLVQTIIK